MTNDRLGSTYRMQLAGIGFAGARAQVPYLDALGIETLYVSPILAAVPGSTHGYDVIDHGRLDPQLGTACEFEALLAELAAHQMRLLVDIVPNHMAAHPTNRWWWDLLREGRQSDHAAVFDVDWARHGGRVLLPSLSRPLAEVRESTKTVVGDSEPLLELDGQQFPLREFTNTDAGPEAVINQQHYRPAYWRLSAHEGNYRRFFNIDGLIGIRVEDPSVFEETHALILDICRDERVAGVRVDHIDGLADPADYAARLAKALSRGNSRAVVLVEKVLSGGELLRPDWAVDGTTGYEFANLAGGLFVQEQGARALADLGAELTGEARSFSELFVVGKREVLVRSFPGALQRLASLALEAIETDTPGSDLALDDVRAALAEMTVRLKVYRTYLDGRALEASDRALLDQITSGAELPAETQRAMSFIRKGFSSTACPGNAWLEVAQCWQQLTGAAMAKAVEDMATYRYSGLMSHAEVGCDPDHASASPMSFHHLARSHRRRAASLNATSTHDSKRNEDARARLYALSEAAPEWEALVRRWHRRYAKQRAGGPDTHDELLTYQTLAALWPLDGRPLSKPDWHRAQNYAVKAAKEAKQRTDWVDPDRKYEAALTTFVARLARQPRFTQEMGRLVARIGPTVATNALGLVVLKTVAPGVPDFYQGTELFEPTLTDPDNRLPVDYQVRCSLLGGFLPLDAPGAARTAEARRLARGWVDGRVKMFTIRALLHLRRKEPELFDKGTYLPLPVQGVNRDHLVALARRHGRRFVIALVPRLVLAIAGPRRFAIGAGTWGDTAVMLPGSFPSLLTDAITGRSVRADHGRLAVSDALTLLPVSVLHSGA